MFKTNEGTTDRVLRVVLGAALLIGFFLNLGGSLNWLLLIGIVPLLTGLVGYCALYSVLGINTCKVKK
ncbi:MAG TPA: DUF2892 domain-containing protein [Rhodobacterales bacterium]|nr:DUF2892 domain-containing protein [Rhodobacterales bacterium]